MSEKCSEDLLGNVGADVEVVKKCMKDSFVSGDINQDNLILKSDRAAFIDSSIPYWPAIIINK